MAAPRSPKRTLTRRTAVAYLRVSTDLERQELGAAAQRAAIERWALAEGVEVLAWCSDEGSGGADLADRPGLLDALAAVAARKATYLVASTLDRFSRDPVSAALAQAELARCGADLLFADGSGNGSDPTAELVRGIRLTVARFERQLIAARIRAALQVKATRGEMVGAPQYGQRLAADGVHLERDPAEQAVIAKALALRAAGHTQRAIVAALAAAGVVGRAGKPLGKTSVFNLLTRAAAAAAPEAAP